MDRFAALSGACLAPPAAGDGVCRVCRGGTCGPFDECWSCRQVGRGLGVALGPVTPISLTKCGSGLYSALVQYKGRPSSISSRQRARISELVARFLAHHARCIRPDGLDLVTVVPSMLVPSAPHPLLGALSTIPGIGERVGEALCVTPGRSIGHGSPDPAAYRCRGEPVRDRRVLLVDDIYTTGAHMHSAALALERAGARSVDLMVVARHQRPSRRAHRRLLEWSVQPENAWREELCVHCRVPVGPTGTRW